jgi:cytochrome c556
VSSTLLAAVLFTGAWAAVAVVGFRIALRYRPQDRQEANNDTYGVYFSMVGLLYAILLAFVVVVAWEQFNAAEESTHTEVTRLSNLFRDAEPLPSTDKERIQQALAVYVQNVIDREYDAMADGQSDGPTTTAYENIWNRFYDTRVEGDGPAATFYDSAIGRLNELGEARRLRILSSQSTIPLPLWILLVGGGLFTIAWLFPFYMADTRVQTVAIGTVGAFTGFVLFLVYALQHPFAGDIAIDPAVYQSLLDGWQDKLAG